jgi:hypothetical protein
VNGERIERKVLSKGDVITLANKHLVFGEYDFPSEYERPQKVRIGQRETDALPQITETEQKDKEN